MGTDVEPDARLTTKMCNTCFKCFNEAAAGLWLRSTSHRPRVRPLPCKDVACAFRPQPEGDFNSLKGKFKILMYEVGIAKALDTCARTPVPTGRFVREPGDIGV